MEDCAAFAVRPPLRCYELVNSLTGARCGAPAVVARRLDAELPLGYFCAAHQQTGDEPIADDAPFRRVSVTIDVLFSGVSWDRAKAHAEVLARLERLVADAGGVINLHACRSQLGAVVAAGGRQAPRSVGGRQ